MSLSKEAPVAENETDSTEMTIWQIINACEPMGNLGHLLIGDVTEEDEDQFFGVLEDL